MNAPSPAPAQRGASVFRFSIAWLALYVAVMGSVLGGLVYARRQALEQYSTAEAQAEWDAFRREMQSLESDPLAPVARRAPQSDEPPTLRLLRDYFGVVVALSLLLASVLFATLMVMIRGVMATQFTPHEDSPAPGTEAEPNRKEKPPAD